MKSSTPSGAVARGLFAGAIGTGFMTAWQELSARLQPSDEAGDPQSRPPADPWEEAPAPAKVAKRVGEGVFEKEVPADLIPLLGNVTHWVYGSGWGILYGVGAASTRKPLGLRAGAVFGAGVWLISYVQLVPMGLYEPPWRYPVKDLAMDLSYHLVYGAGVGAAFRVLERS